MQPTKPKWRDGGLLLVCEKCYKTRVPEEDPGVAARYGDFDIRVWLKDRLKAAGLWGKIRATGTTCLDVCPKARCTATFVPCNGPVETLVYDPIDERDALYDAIVQKLDG